MHSLLLECDLIQFKRDSTPTQIQVLWLEVSLSGEEVFAFSSAFSSGKMVFHWTSHLLTEREPFPPDPKQHLCLFTVPENGKNINSYNFYHRLSTAQNGAVQTGTAQLLCSYLPGFPLLLVSDFIVQCTAQPLASIGCFPGQQEVS